MFHHTFAHIQRSWPASLFGLALAAAFWQAPESPPLVFAEPPPALASALPPQFVADLLPRTGASAGAASLAQRADGRLIVAWEADNEAADDSAIWFSIRDKDETGWGQPYQIANLASTAAGTFAHLRGVGQPVLYVEGSWLHLWYVGRGWFGDVLLHSLSTDGGKSWSKPARLQTSPLAHIDTRFGQPPFMLADGGLGLPLGGRDGWLRLAPTGQILDKIRLPAHDAGQLAAAGLPTTRPNTPFALLRLKSGRRLLAGTPPDGPDHLQLWLSGDAGQTLQASRQPEISAESTNPALLLDRDGRIHLAYTSRSRAIGLASFSEAWLDEARP